MSDVLALQPRRPNMPAAGPGVLGAVGQPGSPGAAGSTGAAGFIPLDPWMTPPDQRLLRLLDADTWSRHHLLPLRLDEHGLLAAAGGAIEPPVLDALRTALSQPVRVLYAARDEVDFWLDVLTGRRTWAEAMVDGLAHLLQRLGLHVILEASLPEMAREALSVENVMAAFGLTEEVAVETLALRARIPQVRLERYGSLRAAYAELLPAPDAQIMRVVPLLVQRGLALFATPNVLGRRAVEQLQRLVGLEVRLLLCAPSTFGAAFREVYGWPLAPRVAPPTPAATFAALRTLEGAGSLRGALDRVANVTHQSPVATALRLGFVQPWDVQRARAQVLGMLPLHPQQLRVDRAQAERGSPALWRRWRCVPVEARAGRAVVLACDAPPSETRSAAVQALLGDHEVAFRYVEPADLDPVLKDGLPAAKAEPYTFETHLAESGIVPPRRLAEARRLAERDDLGPLEALARIRAVSPEDIVEARSIALNRPWIRLAHYAPDPVVSDLLPEAVARAELGLPLRRHGHSLTVALLNGRDQPTPGALERSTGGLAVDPILAVVDDPEEAVDRWYAHLRDAPQLDVAEGYRDFGSYLVRKGLLSRDQVDRVWQLVATARLPLDRALTERGLLRPEQAIAAFRDHLALGEAHLEPRPRKVEIVDALGQVRAETVWEDPVNRDVARLLPAKLAIEHGALVQRLDPSSGVAEVAFANPLDERAVEVVEAALKRPLRILVAPRRVLEVAQRRVYASKSLGERLLEAGVITEPQLTRALQVHDQAGIRVGQALVNLGFVAEDELAATLADQAGLPFVDLRAAEPDIYAARLLPMDLERERGVLPLYDDGAAVVLACTDLPESVGVDEIEALLARPVQPVIVTESAFDDALNTLYRDEYLEHSASNLVSRSPDDSARWVLSKNQKLFLWGLLAFVGVGFVLAPRWMGIQLMSLSTLFYVSFSAYKFYLAYRAMAHTLEVETTADEVAALDDRLLPIYTILVPVYREAEVFPILARAIGRLDYPKAKLDVKILLEEDDHETIAVAKRSRLPSHFKLVVVPHGTPKGKPKACNYGLIHAQGEYVVIYDAEDIPEPDQLKKAIVAFEKGDENLACVQGKLNYFNRDQNLLTRWFTTEYSMWFDLFLPGLDASGAPIPLGGTSNHFKTARLRELGAWDPHNVTEDADLGIRLYKAGWKTAVIDSTTYEEANSEVYNWIRQRSRWVKGYIQTYLVHMRHPVRLWKAIGWRAFVSFQLVIGGTFFGFLVNPIFWFLTALWFTTRAEFIKEIFPPPFFYIGALGLYFGNFAFTYLNVAGCLRRQYYDMVKYALLSPLYWALMSLAAWKGFLQLFYAPSYWEKTKHGLSRGTAAQAFADAAPPA